MDMMTRMGGRKFLMALLVIGAAMFLELSGRTLSANMAGFLVAVLGSFHLSNYASSKSYFENKPQGGSSDGAIHKKLDGLTDAVDRGFGPEALAKLTTRLTDLDKNVAQAQVLAAQVGQALINQTKVQGR